jgi:hypothetical protein
MNAPQSYVGRTLPVLFSTLARKCQGCGSLLPLSFKHKRV